MLQTIGTLELDDLSNTDPFGLDTYLCSVRLGGGRKPDSVCMLDLCHQYLCVTDSKGNPTCGGQGTPSGASEVSKIARTVPGTNDSRDFDKNKCPSVDKVPPCFDDCVREKLGGPRPPYNDLNLFGGTNCQKWASDIIKTCRHCGHPPAWFGEFPIP